MKVELKEVEECPTIEAGDLVICENGYKYLIATNGTYFQLISIDEFYIVDDKYTFTSLMKDLHYLGCQRIIKSKNLKLIEL